MAVGATAEQTGGFGVASFSNTKPNLMGPGANVTSARAGGGLTSMSGTSMATPHVAGVAALWPQKIKAQFGIMNASILQSSLIANCDLSGFPAPIRISDIGNGLVQAPKLASAHGIRLICQN